MGHHLDSLQRIFALVFKSQRIGQYPISFKPIFYERNTFLTFQDSIVQAIPRISWNIPTFNIITLNCSPLSFLDVSIIIYNKKKSRLFFVKLLILVWAL